jgi:hypothetical protein
VRSVDFSEAAERFRGRRVAIVGSGPGSLDNEPGMVDSHEVVVRVSNYKTGPAQGKRCDVHYSFYGSSIRTTIDQLQRDGVTLCMCKLPNSQPIESSWHRERGKLLGIDYRYIYQRRASWWPCDVFIPDDVRFLAKFNLLGQHQPTTGFAAILDVLECEPAALYLTGFDFFASGLHNVDEKWKPGDPTDPICHRPDLELQWLRDNRGRYPITFDRRLAALI